MDKAIKLLKAFLEPDAEDRMDFNDNSIIAGHHESKEWVYAAEALAELQAHKAKIEELKEWYKNRRDFFMSQKEYVRGQEAEKIHQKLEELDK